MGAHWQGFWRAVVLFALVPGLMIAAPVAAGPHGNSANAKACQKDGWAELARTESPYTAFQNQDECVSYGAQGGEIVAVKALSPVISIEMSNDRGYCVPTVTATGFAPKTAYAFVGYYALSSVGEAELHRGEVTTDGDGNLSLRAPSYANGKGVTYRIVIGGYASDAQPFRC